MDTIKFELSEGQTQKYIEWRKTKETVYCGAAGGCYSFRFNPTGLGLIIVVHCSDGTELDLTEWEYF